ncbi:MAG: SRPBCC family protein [Bauldia sp.]
MQRSVTHGTFKLERSYKAAPSKVYRAFADAEAKRKWFVGPPDWIEGEVSLDFRVGGYEINEGGPEGGPISRFVCLYQDIIPNERFIYTYEMFHDAKRISVSLATMELRPEGSGTRLVLTEQGAFLDGFDDPTVREEGTRGLLEQLAVALDEAPAERSLA